MKRRNLSGVQSFAGFTDSELATLRRVAEEREYHAGERISEEGQVAKACLILLQGRVLLRKRIDGKETTLAMLGAGSVVGQMALIDGRARSASIVAHTDVRALVLERDVFQRLLRSLSPFALRFQYQIAVAGVRQLRVATQAIGELLLDAEKAQHHKGERRRRSTRNRRRSSAAIRVALDEFSVDIDELDKVEVSIPAGQVPRDGRDRY